MWLTLHEAIRRRYPSVRAFCRESHGVNRSSINRALGGQSSDKTRKQLESWFASFGIQIDWRETEAKPRGDVKRKPTKLDEFNAGKPESPRTALAVVRSIADKVPRVPNKVSSEVTYEQIAEELNYAHQRLVEREEEVTPEIFAAAVAKLAAPKMKLAEIQEKRRAKERKARKRKANVIFKYDAS